MEADGGRCSVCPPCCHGIIRVLRTRLLLTLNAAGIVLAFVIAFSLREARLSQDAIMWIGLPGDVFLRLLKMTIVPIIVCNVIAGSSSVDPASNGRAGLLALIWNVILNFLGSTVGLLIALLSQPGVGLQVLSVHQPATSLIRTQDVFADLIRNLFPDNIVKATLYKTQTAYESGEPVVLQNTTRGMRNDTSTVMTRHLTNAEDTNILGLLFFCGVFGIAIGMLKDKGEPLRKFFQAGAEVTLLVLGWFLWVAPIGICSLIVAAIVSVENLEDMMKQVSIFFGGVIGGIVFQELLLLPAMFFLFLRQNPYPILVQSSRAWAIAFASSGSACAMPEMWRVLDEHGCDHRLASLVVPINVTLNAFGSSLFIAAAVVFLSQVESVTVTSGQYLIIWILTGISSMVLPSVPSASIVTIVMILTTLSIPTANIGLLFTVEWFLDRLRTTCNVIAEIYGSIIIDHLCKGKVKT